MGWIEQVALVVLAVSATVLYKDVIAPSLAVIDECPVCPRCPPAPIAYVPPTFDTPPKFAITAAYHGTGYTLMGHLAQISKRSYAAMHNYAVFVDNDLLHGGMTWNQMSAIRTESLRRHLPNFEWVWWTDCDIIIMNPSITLESIVGDLPPEIDIIVTRDWGDRQINPGSFLLRRSKWSMEFLDLWEQYIEKNVHKDDLLALEEMVKEKPDVLDHIMFYRQRVINSYPHVDARDGSYVRMADGGHDYWMEGDFVVQVVNCLRDNLSKDPLICLGIAGYYLGMFEEYRMAYEQGRLDSTPVINLPKGISRPGDVRPSPLPADEAFNATLARQGGYDSHFGFDHVYVINLHRRWDRRYRAVKHLTAAGLDAEVFFGIDHQKVKANPDAFGAREFCANEDCVFKGVGYRGSPGQVAYGLTSRAIWQDIVDKGYKSALIIEDDMRLRDGFLSNYAQFRDDLAKIQDWDYIAFQRGAIGRGEDQWVSSLLSKSQPVWGTAAYALSASGAKKMLHEFEKLKEPVNVQVGDMMMPQEALRLCTATNACEGAPDPNDQSWLRAYAITPDAAYHASYHYLESEVNGWPLYPEGTTPTPEPSSAAARAPDDGEDHEL